jgi:Arc/MetJ-type ribon-helix-helix transcriptional regulator
MPIIQVPDEAKAIIDRHVAEGAAASEANFVLEAVRRYAGDVENDEDEIIAAANEGIAAIARGDYVTISGPDDVAALRERVWASATILAEKMRAAEVDSGAAPWVEKHTDG